MNTYKIELEIKSPLITPIMGDTLFGHLCWGIYYHEGKDSIEEFLSEYEKEPLIVISNGFPHNKLPIPLLMPSKPKLNITLEKLQNIKRVKKIKYIDSSYFFNNNEFSENKIYNYLKDSKNENISFKKGLSYRNTINRMTNTTIKDGSGLFSSTLNWYKKGYIIDVYVVSSLGIDTVMKYFQWGLEMGYGADKSIGKGVLELNKIESIEFPKQGNRAMSLGNFVPKTKLLNLRADVFTKYGKLGGNYVYEKNNPFKKPIIMYKEGASFSHIEDIAYIGSMIGNIHNDSKIKHHAYAPVIYFYEEVESE